MTQNRTAQSTSKSQQEAVQQEQPSDNAQGVEPTNAPTQAKETQLRQPNWGRTYPPTLSSRVLL